MIERLKGLPKLSATGAESGPIAVCAPGPSLRETWEAASAFSTIMAVKSAHDFLIEHGVIPKYAVTKDDSERAIPRAFTKAPHPGVTYICSGGYGKKFFGNAVVPRFLKANHMDIYKMGTRDCRKLKLIHSVGSGGMALMAAYALGFREMHLFGFDNCFGPGDVKRVHGYVFQGEKPVVLTLKGREFRMNYYLQREMRYIREFRSSMPGVKLIPHGDGVFSHLWGKAA